MPEPNTNAGAVEALAEKLHREFRGTFKALHTGRNRPGHLGLPKNCIQEHDHGWEYCHKKEYFRRRAQRWLERERP